MRKIRCFAFHAVLLSMAFCVSGAAAAKNRELKKVDNKVMEIGDGELFVDLGAKASQAEKRVAELLAELTLKYTGGRYIVELPARGGTHWFLPAGH